MQTASIKLRARRRLVLALATLTFLPFLLMQPAAAQTTYTVTDLGTLGGTMSLPTYVSDSGGVVVGISTLLGDTVTRGFLWENGVMRDLGSLPAGPNVASSNANGRLQIEGFADGASTNHDSNACYCVSNLDCHSFSWQNGTMTDLDTMGGNSSRANWINSQGQIVGISQISAIDPNGFATCGGTPGSQINRAYLFENGKFKDLGTLGGYDAGALSINDRGQICGDSDVTTTIDSTLGFVPHHAFLWDRGVMTDLGTLGGGFSLAENMSTQGVVIGFSTLPAEQHQHPFLWQAGAVSDLGVLDGDTDGDAVGINSFGQVVGFSGTSGTTRGFIWQTGVMADLNTLIDPSSGFQIAAAFWINDAGEIAAQALVESTGEMHAVLLTPSNNSIRGNSIRVPLTDSLRKLLLQKYGNGRMNFLRSSQ
jgi:probable HAF family extracellular repeat protein